jgi:hypothetical protein
MDMHYVTDADRAHFGMLEKPTPIVTQATSPEVKSPPKREYMPIARDVGIVELVEGFEPPEDYDFTSGIVRK